MFQAVVLIYIITSPSTSYPYTSRVFFAYSRAGRLLGRVHLTILPDPFANGSRRVARVHTASTASGSSGTLRPHQEVFAVDANGSRRVGSAV